MTLPGVPRYNRRRYGGVLWAWGMDPAARVDFFGLNVHGVPPKPKTGPWMPFLAWGSEFRHEEYTETISWLKSVVAVTFPPTYGIVDATRDTMVAQEIEKAFGESVIEAIHMTQRSNYEGKQTGYQTLNDGYVLPNPARLKDRAFAEYVVTLKRELLAEIVDPITSGIIPSFSKPPGKHNDGARSWEYSLEAAFKIMKGAIGENKGRRRPRVKKTAAAPPRYDPDAIYGGGGGLLSDRPLGGAGRMPY